MSAVLPKSREQVYLYLAELRRSDPFLLTKIHPAFKLISGVIDEIYSGKEVSAAESLQEAIFGK